jgi:hypothetical protein
MTPLDSFQRWSGPLDESARRYLSASERESYEAIPPRERQEQLRALLSSPIRHFSAVNEAYFRARWAETLCMLQPGPELALLEVATGDTDMIPQAMARSHPGSRYVAANMNRELNARLLRRVEGLDVRMELVADDAAGIERRFGPGTFDVVALQHGVNDVVQAILCSREGVDTVFTDWMETLPEMIRIIRREVGAGTLEAHVRSPFIALMRSLIEVLKRGGVVAINHYMFQLDLDWGYPPELWAGFVPLVRGWVRELSGVQEVFLEGFEPTWWLFLRKR